MTEPARVAIEMRGRDVIAGVEGEVDITNVDEVQARLSAAVPGEAGAMVVDLTDTTYLDSAGLRMLFTLAAQLRDRRQELHIVVPNRSNVHRLIEMVEMPTLVRVHTETDEPKA